MGGCVTLSLMLLLRALSMGDARGGRAVDVIPGGQEGSAAISLTSFDANDQTLKLRYKIVNRSNHDGWVCDGIYMRNKALPTDYEVYVDDDGRTLMIRKQLEVPGGTGDIIPRNYSGRYVVLHPGQERTGSFSLAAPVIRHPIFAAGRLDITEVTRVVLRIGFYNEDLPHKIRSILELAAKLGCAELTADQFGYANVDLYNRYFQGLRISRTFGGLSGFSSFWTEGSEQIEIPYTSPALLLNFA